VAKKSLRAQLNQIRAWVRQGRTDAWIAHQLEVPASELREFRRRHELIANGDEDSDVDLRDEIEAEIEAATLTEVEEDEEEDEEDETADEVDEAAAGDDEDAGDGAEDGDAEDGAESRPRRRRRSRGRGRGRGGAGAGDEGSGGRRAKTLEATFDHGDEEGYGLWLDPAVGEDPVYSEHWAGHRAVEVRIEPDRITIRRA
jgi:hypothetical protein